MPINKIVYLKKEESIFLCHRNTITTPKYRILLLIEGMPIVEKVKIKIKFKNANS